MLRQLILVLIILFPAQAVAEALTFVAIATGKSSNQSAYEQFLHDVQPVWARHGMRLVLRAAVEHGDATIFADIALIEAKSRAGFRAYLSDPTYRALAPARLAAVDTLVVLEGRHEVLPPKLSEGTTLNILFQRECASETPGARVSLVGQVKGPVDPLYRKTGCVRFLAADDAPATGVLAGFFARAR